MPRAPNKPDLHLVSPVPASNSSPNPNPCSDSVMKSGPLPGLSALYDLMQVSESRSGKVRRLQVEARALALEELGALDQLLVRTAAAASEVADGGEAYPVGARELASRLAMDLNNKAETLRMILGRMG